jgi:integrase
MTRKRNRGNGEGTIFKRVADGPYIISWYDASGKRKTHCTKTSDRSAAQRILAKKLADVALRRDGVVDVRQESIVIEASRSIETHLIDFEGMMNARQRTERHIAQTLFLIRQVCASAVFEKPSDITADGVNRVLMEVKACGKSARTMQARVVAMKAFTRWLADHGKLAHDPLRGMKRPGTKMDRRLRRRMLLPDEWPCLRAATIAAGTRDGMNPLDRVALYATAIQTGLRSAELRSLTKADLFLAGERPYVRCRAENTKNSQEARQYIQLDLAAELRQIVSAKTPTANVFNMPDEFSVATMLRGDLAAARKHWLDELKHDPNGRAMREESDFLAVTNHQGEELDFHGLRHTTGAWLALQGVHPNVIKSVMRHSCITLTMDTYGHLLPDQHADAIGGMASMMAPTMPLAATGSVNATAVGAAAAKRKDATVSAKECASLRTASADEAERTEHKPLQIAELCESVREDAAESESASCRARTYGSYSARHSGRGLSGKSRFSLGPFLGPCCRISMDNHGQRNRSQRGARAAD